MELRICHMYPDVLNLYGDRGNVICMTKRLEWRGIDVSVTKLPIGDSRSLADFDLIFIGGGQDFEQQVLLSDLHRGKDREIKAAVEDGAPFLCVCGGYQLMGRYYQTHTGEKLPFIGALDLYDIFLAVEFHFGHIVLLLCHRSLVLGSVYAEFKFLHLSISIKMIHCLLGSISNRGNPRA